MAIVGASGTRCLSVGNPACPVSICTPSHVVLNCRPPEASTRSLAAKFFLLNCTLNIRNRGTPSIKTRKIVTSKFRQRFRVPDSVTCGSASRTGCRRQVASTQNWRPHQSDARSHGAGNTFRRMDYFLLFFLTSKPLSKALSANATASWASPFNLDALPLQLSQQKATETPPILTDFDGSALRPAIGHLTCFACAVWNSW